MNGDGAEAKIDGAERTSFVSLSWKQMLCAVVGSITLPLLGDAPDLQQMPSLDLTKLSVQLISCSMIPLKCRMMTRAPN